MTNQVYSKGDMPEYKVTTTCDGCKKNMSVIEDIKEEIKDLHNSHMIHFVDADGAVDTCLNIIDRHIGAKEQEK